MTDEEYNNLLEALKSKALGNESETTTEIYERDKETGKMKLHSKKTIRTKNEIDTSACVKMIDIETKRREKEESKETDYNSWTDEELEAEKQRLLKQLKEENQTAFSLIKG